MILYIVTDLDDNVLFSMYKQNDIIKGIIRRSTEVHHKNITDKFGVLKVTTYITKHYKCIKQVD